MPLSHDVRLDRAEFLGVGGAGGSFSPPEFVSYLKGGVYQPGDGAAEVVAVDAGPSDPTQGGLGLAVVSSGYRSAGYNREPYLELGENKDAWVTELQKPVITR